MVFSNDPASQINQLPISLEVPRDKEAFYDVLSLWMKMVGNVVNLKTGGLFSLQELINSEQYYTVNNPNQFRIVYRKTFDMVVLNGGPIGAGATVFFPHGITGLLYATLIYGSATSSDAAPNTLYFTQVYPNVYLDSVNVYFINPLASTLVSAIVVAEYLKN